MAWTRDTTSGVFTHAGTTRDYWDPETTLPVSCEIRLQLADYNDHVKVYVRGAADGRTGYEIGIEGANVIIRKISYGVTGSALATAAHGLASDEAFTLRVRLTAETISGYIVKTTGAEVPVTYATADLNRQTGWGFVSNVNGAIVTLATVAEVGLSNTTSEDVLIAAGGGDVYGCFNRTNLQLIGSRAFPTTAKVSMTVIDSKVYAVGGGKAVVIDPGEKTVTAYVPTAGDLPGTTGTGTTLAGIVTGYRGRIYFGAIQDEANILYTSAVGEPLTLDTAELAEGHAEAIGVGRNQQIGDAVVAFAVGGNNALVIGCTNSTYVLLGDPADGGAELSPVSLDCGASGPNAMALVAEGVVAGHSPEGVWVLPAGGQPIQISHGVLDAVLTFARADRGLYTVTLIRDPARHGLHVFISSEEGGDTHLWYDERTGKYQPGTGGWFPETYPMNPTCACLWRGRVVIGTDDGYIVEFSDTADLTDYDGEAINAFVTLSLVDEEPLDNDTILDHVYAHLGSGSGDATLTVYGGKTAEAAYTAAQRWTLGTYTLTATPRRCFVKKRGAALALVLRNAVEDEDLIIEAIDAEVFTGRPLSRAGWKAALAVGAPCAVPAGSGSPASPNSGASAVSGPGQGSLPNGGSPTGSFGGSTPGGWSQQETGDPDIIEW